MKKKENLIIAAMFLCAIVTASLPLLGSVVYGVGAQDTFFHTQRIWSIKNALSQGQFPVRIYNEIYNGYGYSSSLLYPELFLYFPAVLCLLGVPLSLSYNIFLLLVNAATVFIAFYSYRYITRNAWIGAIAALLYVLSTYRLLDMYTRGSMGEFLALIFTPLALCGLVQIKRGEYDKWKVLAFAFAGLIQSHVLSFVLMTLTAVLFVLINIRTYLKKEALLAVLKAILLVVLLNLWFLLPMFQAMRIETEVTSGYSLGLIAFIGSSGFWQTGASVVQLFDVLNLSAGGTETWGAGIADCMPKTPGILLILGSILCIFAVILYQKDMKKDKKIVWGCLSAGGLSVLLTTNLFPWKVIQKADVLKSFFEKFQFMWRFNVLAILFLSIAAAYAFYYFFVFETGEKGKAFVLLGMSICMVSLLFVNQFVKQSEAYNNEAVLQAGFMDRLYVTPGFDTNGDGELSSNIQTIHYQDILRENGKMSFSFYYDAQEEAKTEAQREEPLYIELPLTYYPGYQVYLNDERIEAVCSIKGILKVYLPDDCTGGTFSVHYEESMLWKAGNVISLITMIWLLSMGVYKKANFSFIRSR